MNYLKKYLVLLSIAFLYSCTTNPIDVDLKPLAPKMVVASQFTPDSILYVTVTKSFSALTTFETMSLSDAEKITYQNLLVTFSFENKTDTLFELFPGVYSTAPSENFIGGTRRLFQANTPCELQIKDLLTSEASWSSSVMLPMITFDSIRPIIEQGIFSLLRYKVSVKYTLTDIPNTDNWYMVNYYVPETKDSMYFANIIDNVRSYKINLLEAYNEITGVNAINAQTEIFTDEGFKNRSFTYEKVLRNTQPSDSNLIVSVSNISQGFYEFLNTQKKAGKLFNQLVKEPLNYPSNVQNGYGYFNTHLTDVRIFNLNDYK